MKKIISLIVCLILILSTLLSLSSCSQPPEYSEIEGRLKDLIEASAEVNSIFFGEGLPTYERVMDPRSTTKVYKEKILNENGEEEEKLYYYYEVTDERYKRVIAYRSGIKSPYTYVQVLTYPEMSMTPVYFDDYNEVYAYVIEDYVEPEHEFYYNATDPVDYDYVRFDCEYSDVNSLKKKAEAVYSSVYLESIYSSMFVGTVASNSVGALNARYMEYADDMGNVYLMESNKFKPLITETRVFDYSTAKMVKPSNAEYVNVEIDSYLPSNPSKREVVKISLILENGKWMLDSAPY